MARKSKKKTAKKVKASKVKKTTAKKAKSRRKAKAASPGLGQRLSGAYRAVVDSVTGTGKLRDRLEKPGTSESE